MSKKIQLQIPKPCHEDWSKMTLVEQGRFCDSCEKKVVDFTRMNDEQVLAFFRKPTTGSVCGRFLNDQLNRDIVIPGKRIPWLKYFFQFALPIFLTSLKSSAQGNIVIKEKITTNCTQRTVGKVAPTKLRQEEIINEIKGRVIDEKGNGIPYATVSIKGSKDGVACNDSGYFQLNVQQHQGVITLVSSCVGFISLERTIDVNRDAVCNFQMELAGILSGETVVVVGLIQRKKSAPIPLIKRILKDTVFNFLKVYPNPVSIGSALKIKFKKVEFGEYYLDLINIQGQTIFSSLVDNQSQGQTYSITIPSVSAGNYLLRMTNKNSRKSYTEKIIVK